MRKSAAAHIVTLSLRCADPTKAARAMLESGKKNLKMTKKQISYNTLDRLLKKQLGTEDVESMSRKFIKNSKGSNRDQGYINYVMKRRKDDAWNLLMKAKAEYKNSIKYLVTLLTEEEMAVYSAFMRFELAKDWEEKVKIMRKKIKALEEKQFPWKKPVAPKI